jgi:hypothetical protein
MHEHEHPQRTRRSHYRYLFTTKHHRGKRGPAQWLPDLSEDDEFAVFDWADEWEVADKVGNLFGALEDSEEGLRFLGIWQEQIAKFPRRPQG